MPALSGAIQGKVIKIESHLTTKALVKTNSTEDQTPFMRKLKIQAHVGGWTISFNLDDQGIVHEFTPQFHPFYDRGFYTGDHWKYHWK